MAKLTVSHGAKMSEILFMGFVVVVMLLVARAGAIVMSTPVEVKINGIEIPANQIGEYHEYRQSKV